MKSILHILCYFFDKRSQANIFYLELTYDFNITFAPPIGTILSLVSLNTRDLSSKDEVALDKYQMDIDAVDAIIPSLFRVEKIIYDVEFNVLNLFQRVTMPSKKSASSLSKAIKLLHGFSDANPEEEKICLQNIRNPNFADFSTKL